MATLYRKYRPGNFKEVVNQNHIKITLENQIKNNSIAHAYLFCGPRAVGKTTLARVLSKAVNCTQRLDGQSEPCGECLSCKEISANRAMDVAEIDAASHTGVDNVRENIINIANVTPSQSKFKVFIIDEVHMLSISAFNALLKIMEEPPSYIIFVLCTTEAHKIPKTIISRCQRFDFKKIGVNDIANKLEMIANAENIKIERKILESIARQSGGHMRDAESILTQVIAIGGKEVTEDDADLVIPRTNIEEVIKLISFLVNKNTIESIQLVNKNIDNGIDLKIFTNELVETLRKVALAKTSPLLAEKLGIELGESLEKKINEITANLRLDFILRMIDEFKTANLTIEDYPVSQMSLEIAIIKLTYSPSPLNVNPMQRNSVEPIITSNPINSIPAFNPVIQPANNFNQPTIQSQRVINQTQTNSINGEINLETVINKWNLLLTSMQSVSPSISFVLRACQPVNLEGSNLILAFKYKFHKDQADKPENKTIIMNVLQSIHNHSFYINTTINDSTSTTAEPVPTNNFTQPVQPVQIVQPVQPIVIEPSIPQPTENYPVDNIDKTNNTNDNTDMLSNILETFGGKIVG
ncbi:MAG: DNA polymerase III subunit gamma/tau [Candidatus Falkowbacteria bacterium]|nr:DNA polymerase III subunit gamma/tau [Candidatus Falkowbacteria bacterium]